MITTEQLEPLGSDIFSLRQLREHLGCPDSDLYSAVRRGLLEKVGHGKYKVVAGAEGIQADTEHYVTIKLDCTLPVASAGEARAQADALLTAVTRLTASLPEVVEVRRGMIGQGSVPVRR